MFLISHPPFYPKVTLLLFKGLLSLSRIFQQPHFQFPSLFSLFIINDYEMLFCVCNISRQKLLLLFCLPYRSTYNVIAAYLAGFNFCHFLEYINCSSDTKVIVNISLFFSFPFDWMYWVTLTNKITQVWDAQFHYTSSVHCIACSPP